MKRFAFVAAYAAALLASSLLRWSRPESAPPDGVTTVPVPEVRDGSRGASPVRFAFRDLPGAPERMPIVLVHGSPGDGSVCLALGRGLAGERRVIIPDLPGFGSSTHGVPDYSFRAHAVYLKHALGQLGIRKVHLLGFSMGGGVVLSLQSMAPDTVASIVMLSAIGVQEAELTGNYSLNHAIHGAQLAAIWPAFNLLPHFGLLDGIPFNVAYARNFFDSDQRPLRGVLQNYSGPMLILQGTKDPFVPERAAREHHRLVPHSELVLLDGNHFMAFMEPERLLPAVRRFLAGVDSGTARRR